MSATATTLFFYGSLREKPLLAAVIGRTVRFFAVAGAMALFGPKARRWFGA